MELLQHSYQHVNHFLNFMLNIYSKIPENNYLSDLQQ